MGTTIRRLAPWLVLAMLIVAAGAWFGTGTSTDAGLIAGGYTCLIIDDEGIDDGISTIQDLAASLSVTPAALVNDDSPTEVGNPALLWNTAHAGTTIWLPTGQTDDFGWFIAANPTGSSAQSGTTFTSAEFLAGTVPQAELDKVSVVSALGDPGLKGLVGGTYVAVVYDSDISSTGTNQYNLQGARLGQFAFTVNDWRAPQINGSSSTLVDLQVTALPGPVADDACSEQHPQNPSIDIEKATNGVDADIASGPTVTVGANVLWTYVVTNTGNVDLASVVVTDDQGVVPVLVIDAASSDAILGVGEAWTYTASGVASAGQYANLGTVTATAPDQSAVSDEDPSHYFGKEPPELEDATVTIVKDFEGPDDWEFGFLIACLNERDLKFFTLGGGESKGFVIGFSELLAFNDIDEATSVPCVVAEEPLAGDWTVLVDVQGTTPTETGTESFGTFVEFRIGPGDDVTITFENIPGYAAQPPTGQFTLPDNPDIN